MIVSDRRNFIKKTAGFAAGTAIITSLPLACQSRKRSPNEIINIALIGVRGRGWSALMSHLKLPNVECIAFCDVDSNIMEERAAEFEKLKGKKVDLYSDFRKLLERIDFDETIGAILEKIDPEETLVVVTADHETGGFTLSAATMQNPEGGTYSDYSDIGPTFSTGGHSATLIPVFAYGKGAEEFAGVYENNEIFDKIMKVLGKTD